MHNNQVYLEKGYSNRHEYLCDLAEEYDLNEETVFELANFLGPEEDFDGLVTSVQDFSGIYF